ncbi:MAG: hypothetical protein JNN15_06100 [Blastocatellia bacterium]|nr:hypothetical protein [Blastocatellia bacterium]
MQEKEAAEKALSEEQSVLEDLREEEVVQAVEDLRLGKGEGSHPSLIHDRKVEAELKDMFRDIVAQFITPVGKSIRALASGDLSDKNIEICIGGLKPLIMAAEEIHYNDIYDVLKSIEQPLMAFKQGKKRVLSKKDLKNITTDYKELKKLITRSVGGESIESITGARSIAPTSAITSPAEIHISDLLVYFKDADSEDLQKLYATGLTKLGDLSNATIQEIIDSTGLPTERAVMLKRYANNAISAVMAALPGRSDFSSEKLSEYIARHTAEMEREEGSELAIPSNVKEQWTTAAAAVVVEMALYSQAVTVLKDDLERIHKSLLSLRVCREKFKTEVDFYRDDLIDLFESNEYLNDEIGTATNFHRQLLRDLRRGIEVINSMLNKTEVLYDQLDETLEETQETEAAVISLRRRKRLLSKGGLRRRANNEQEEEREISDTPLPRRLS